MPDVIRLFPQLWQLGLARNDIVEVPKWVWSMPAWTDLDLRYNTIEAIPEIPETSTSALRVLMLDSNRLSQLPASLGKLKELTWLSADFNHLQVCQ